MSRRNTDPAVAQRARLRRLEQLAKARVEDAALEAALAAAVAHGEDKGAEFHRVPQKRGEGRKPIRRLTGLGWLLGKDRITKDQYEAGARYASAYQKAKPEARIKSILDREVGTGDGCTIAAMLATAEERVYAAERLARYRRQLAEQPALISACDLICGEEMTPREAANNGRGADSIEAVLKVALDILFPHMAPRNKVAPQNVEIAA